MYTSWSFKGLRGGGRLAGGESVARVMVLRGGVGGRELESTSRPARDRDSRTSTTKRTRLTSHLLTLAEMCTALSHTPENKKVQTYKRKRLKSYFLDMKNFISKTLGRGSFTG